MFYIFRCVCDKCSLENIVKAEECQCCREINVCVNRMDCCGQEIKCITDHPAFENGCLDRWVLRLAAMGLKTKTNKLYTAMYEEGKKTEEECIFQ